jgi:hypothetical protein
MEIKIRVDGLRRLAEKFEAMPDLVERELREELKAATEGLRDYAASHHRFATRGGETERKGVRADYPAKLTGVVWLATDVAVYQHEGTGLYGPRRRAFAVRPKDALALRWAAAGGQGYAFAKKVVNPGIRPDPYLYDAAETKRPEIVSHFAARVKKLIKE